MFFYFIENCFIKSIDDYKSFLITVWFSSIVSFILFMGITLMARGFGIRYIREVVSAYAALKFDLKINN
jgi:hypothetical protein